jgi:hypothetical protein
MTRISTRKADDNVVQGPIDFSQLRGKQFIPLPEPQEVAIDHRFSAKFYELLSCLDFLPDGGMVLRGGMGCEIKMSGGNVTISAPGDVMVQTGRSIINYAGDDFIAKAHNSADITASNKDLRLKAEVNLDIMGGNSGSGRTLIECRADGSNNDVTNKFGEDVQQSGLILSSGNSNLSMIAGNDLYLRTMFGSINIDAAKGQGSIKTSSNNVINYTNSFSMAYSSGNVESAHIFTQNTAAISGSIIATRQLTITDGGIFANGRMGSIDGQLGKKGPETDGQLAILRQQLDANKNQLRDSYEQAFTTGLYSEKKIGNDDVIGDTKVRPANC